jgi:hypothetical protein
MDKRTFAFSLLLAASAGVAQNSAPSSHFVFDDRFDGDIVINEVRVPKSGEAMYTYYEALGWRGGAAERGVVFTRAHCQFPLCGPSRASLMSGLLPSTLGYDNHMKDEALQERARKLDTELLHAYFSKHGYKTMAVGKISHHNVPKGSVDVRGGRGRFNESTGRLRRNWHQNGTSTDWAMAPDRDGHAARPSGRELGGQATR